MKGLIHGRCAIYIENGMLVLDTTWKGDLTDGNAYENVRYEEVGGKLCIEAEQLQPTMYREFKGVGYPYSTSNIDDLHPSRIKVTWGPKHSFLWFSWGPIVQHRSAASGWQRLKDNVPKQFVSTNYTIITSK